MAVGYGDDGEQEDDEDGEGKGRKDGVLVEGDLEVGVVAEEEGAEDGKDLHHLIHNAIGEIHGRRTCSWNFQEAPRIL